MLLTILCTITHSDAYPPGSQSSARGQYKELTNPDNCPTNTTYLMEELDLLEELDGDNPVPHRTGIHHQDTRPHPES